jgi:dipeptidyl aminopeptidase/acylaminoacyl peptidase
MKLVHKISEWIFVLTVFIVLIFGLTLKSINSPVYTENKLTEIELLSSEISLGGELNFEKWLGEGEGFKKYIVSFYSSGFKQYAYLSVPTSVRPANGFPVIVLNHGYQIPKLYTPDGNYVPHLNAFGSSGFIVLKPDYRGHGESLGAPASAYFSDAYSVDILNAISAIKNFPDADTNRIGVFGHSMGGSLGLRVAEASPEVKSLVIWSGVVGDYTDIIFNWQKKSSYKPSAEDVFLRYLGMQELVAVNGTPEKNPEFWNKRDPVHNLNLLKIPVQIHAGMADSQVPSGFSQELFEKLQIMGKNVEYYEYPSANHDIDTGFSTAIARTIEFFNKTLK